MPRTYCFIALISLLTCCQPPENNCFELDIEGLEGTYQHVAHEGKSVVKNWGKRYWELQLNKKQSVLSFFETDRGLNSFELSVNVIREGKRINILHKVILSTGYSPPSQITRLKSGDILLSLLETEKGLESNSQFMQLTTSDTLRRATSLFVRIASHEKDLGYSY